MKQAELEHWADAASPLGHSWSEAFNILTSLFSHLFPCQIFSRLQTTSPKLQETLCPSSLSEWLISTP